MLTSLHLQNFRSFRDLRIEPLARVNLISGKNNVGKSSLLEAIFFLTQGGGQHTLLRLGSFRGLSAEKSGTETTCSWLVNKSSEVSSAATITAKTLVDSPGVERRMVIHDLKNLSECVDLVKPGSLCDELSVDVERYRARLERPGLFIRVDSDGIEGYLVVVFKQSVGSPSSGPSTESDDRERWFAFGRRPNLFPPGTMIVDYRSWSRERDLEVFSKLRSEGKHRPIIEGLQTVDGRIDDLEVLVVASEPEFHARIKSTDVLVPLWTLGEGFQHVLSVLTTIAEKPHSIVLIDEIENGIHYSILPAVWRSIATTATAANVQVFATTHSRECVAAAYEAFVDQGDDAFRVHRLERGRSGEVEAVTYDRESLGVSLEQGWEVR